MRFTALFWLSIISGTVYSQGEFIIHENGLIYNESTMARLGAIVDSLNLKFKTCDLSQTYYSYDQGMATKVSVHNKEARKLIESGVSLEDFKKRFPSRVHKQLWIVKMRYYDYENNSKLEYAGLPFGWNSEPSITLEDNPVNNKTSGWIISKDGEMAFYLSKLERYALPIEYGRLVQYVDCMIDTTTGIYLPQAERSFSKRWDANIKENDFMSWAHSYPNKPKDLDYDKMSDDNFDSLSNQYFHQFRIWDSLRMDYVEEQLKTFPERRRQLAESIEESLQKGNSNREFESYVARYVSPTHALQLKRSRRVMGNCSMDMSPRYHAIEICQLAAETAQWDIFLRSHLDIMNDRFDRASDGSWAWADRKTYLKELEELEIPAVDLLLGTSLRVANVSKNHYWSSISRTGRALIDTEDKEALEQRLINMIQDANLDAYNRLLMAYLFSNYIGYLEDEEQREVSAKRLENIVATLPDYVKAVWNKQ